MIISKVKINPAIAKSALLALVAALLILLPGLKLPYLDSRTDSYFKSSITKAGASYGVCRGVNAAVSVIKESEIQLEPAGIGVSLAAGQILDPLDDMTERASDVLITAIVSLGIQKIAYDLCVAFAPPLIGIALFLFVILSLFKGEKSLALNRMMLRGVLLLAVARFCLPASSMASRFLNETYFTPQIEQAKDALTLGSPELDTFKDFRLPEANGFFGTAKNVSDSVADKSKDLAAALRALAQNMSAIIENLLKISSLYVALFLVQVILLPLLAFWLLVKLADSLFTLKRPYVITHADLPVGPKAMGKR
jgi:hypothetical protein